MKFSLLITVFILIISACNSQEQKQKVPFQSKSDFDESMIESHKRFLDKSSKEITEYINRSNYTFETSGTGLRYTTLEKGSGVQPKKGNEVKIEYSIQFLDGEPVMEYATPKVMSFYIEQSDVETGLHEALQLMKVGEKAEFIFPPHLAFGISGDRNGIPPQSTLIYTIELLATR
tara:strand:- start:2734 stop:3258 length:525 start_codon:yes stop_codon:yes gene_type:complete